VPSGPEIPLLVLRRMFTRVFGAMPLARLSTTHALGTGADAFFTVSLAGSVFFNVSVGAARPRTIGYLALSLAPFVLLAPLVGPLVDRFGHARPAVAASTCLGRGILCLFAAGNLHTLLLYPEAFGILILDKAYAITKSALVPSLVDDDSDLVAANARLTRISTLSGLLGGSIAAGILTVTNAVPVLQIASLVYFAGAITALRIPSATTSPLPTGALERRELQSATVRFAAGAMMLLRAGIGFVVFLVAFELKRAGDPTWFFGLIAFCSVAGGLAGTLASPMLRRRLHREEPLLAVALLVGAAVSLLAAVHLAHPTIAAAVFAVAFGASIGRQGFDSLLQRDAPDAARGRSFARFETLFQLLWVLGALGAVVLKPATGQGLAIYAVLSVLVLVAYIAGVTTRRGTRADGAS
jgi:Na+/melibiose symporter-like transporter